MTIRESITQYFRDKRVFIGTGPGTSIKEIANQALIDELTDAITTEYDGLPSSSPGEAETGTGGEVAPKTYAMPEGYSVDQGGSSHDPNLTQLGWHANADGSNPDGEWDHLTDQAQQEGYW